MKKTKLLSLFLAVSMTAAAFMPVVSAEEQNGVLPEATDFSALTINAGKTGFVKAPANVRIGNNDNVEAKKGNAKLYKHSNVFGLGEEEYAIEALAREQRVHKPYLLFGGSNKEYDISEDFYIQANIFIGEERATDYFRIGGEYSDGEARRTQFVYFQGNGRVSASNFDTDQRYGAAYVPNNWYNVTIAYNAQTHKTGLYIDGKLFDGTNNFAGSTVAPLSVVDGIKNIVLGTRFEKRSTTDDGGLPAWTMTKDMKIVPGTYLPQMSDTTISSEVYTVAANSLYIQSSAEASQAQAYVANVPDTATVADFLANIDVPQGAQKSVVAIDKYDSQTTVVVGSELISGDMSLLVRTADDSLKLYDIRVLVSEQNKPQITSEKFTIANQIIEIKPHTSVAYLMENLIPGTGTAMKLVNLNGTEITTGNVSIDSMRVVAEKGSNEVFYTFKLKDTNVMNPAATISNLPAGDELIVGTFPGPIITKNKDRDSRLYGFGPGSTNHFFITGTSNFKVTKEVMPTSGVAAYKMTSDANGYVSHATGSDLYSKSSALQGAKTITSYKLYLEQGAEAFFMTYRQKSNNSGGTALYDIATPQKSDMLTFKDGKIYIGAAFGSTAFKGAFLEIGSYNPQTEYELMMVQQTPTAASTEVVVEGIYLDGEKIFPLGANASPVDGFYHIPYSISGGINALRSALMIYKGEVYWGDFKIYMADEFNVSEEEDNTDPDLTLTALDSSIEIYADDPLENHMATIKGYGETVVDLREAIDSPIGTELKVLSRTGSAEAPDNAALEAGMIVRVRAMNNHSNVAYYVLSDIINMGGFKAVPGSSALKIERSIRVYKDENIKATLVIASYDTNGKMLGVQIDTKSISEKGLYNFDVELGKGAVSYKTMLLNEAFKPYGSYVKYSENGEILP